MSRQLPHLTGSRSLYGHQPPNHRQNHHHHQQQPHRQRRLLYVDGNNPELRNNAPPYPYPYRQGSIPRATLSVARPLPSQRADPEPTGQILARTAEERPYLLNLYLSEHDLHGRIFHPGARFGAAEFPATPRDNPLVDCLLGTVAGPLECAAYPHPRFEELSGEDSGDDYVCSGERRNTVTMEHERRRCQRAESGRKHHHRRLDDASEQQNVGSSSLPFPVRELTTSRRERIMIPELATPSCQHHHHHCSLNPHTLVAGLPESTLRWQRAVRIV
ncbi:hypothetical protein BZA05DRAFT_102378 [Tricharina praecox]|uniref:uncharacterized protein n=1 Tax=Tricharina praecox TaxID=43433 RepID=UPI002220C6C9|nr:uncharacterized protein BZA05DRAFT_102378 [Tricharina praecox]KAI5857667.1 hypothetical protein BZA05DRAFT_102378 [Tricharina praecox]